MRNQAPKFKLLAIFGLLKRLDGSDYANGAHRSGKVIIVGYGLFENISMSILNQRQILDVIAFFSIAKMIISSYLHLWPTVSKNWKNTALSKWPSYLLQLHKPLEATIYCVR